MVQGQILRDHTALRNTDNIRLFYPDFLHDLCQIICHIFDRISNGKLTLSVKRINGIILAKNPVHERKGFRKFSYGLKAEPRDQNQRFFPFSECNIIHHGISDLCFMSLRVVTHTITVPSTINM